MEKLERIAALGHWAIGKYAVKVIFKRGGRKGNGEEVAYWMSAETYDSMPIDSAAYLEDYQSHGECELANNADIYDIERS